MASLPSDFQKRVQLYQKAGLEDSLGKFTNTTAQTDALKKYVGGGSSSNSSVSSLSKVPTIDVNKIYEDAMANPDIAKATQELAATEAEINAKKAALDETVAYTNDNPFLSEAARKGKISNATDKANMTLQTLEQKRGNLTNNVNNLKGDVQTKLNLALKQYDINNASYQQNLQIFDSMLKSGALTGAKDSDLSELSVATGFSTGTIKSMIQSASSANNKTQLVQTTDNNGNVTIAVVDTNTGKIVNTSTIGGAGKSTGGTDTTVKDTGVSTALKILDTVDNSNYGTKDKLLSKWEIQSAYDQIFQKLGNAEKAKSTLVEAMNRGGYSEWSG